ncbi:MAG: hypothetical protein RR490_05300, partial [Niameybacter sp.]
MSRGEIAVDLQEIKHLREDYQEYIGAVRTHVRNAINEGKDSVRSVPSKYRKYSYVQSSMRQVEQDLRDLQTLLRVFEDEGQTITRGLAQTLRLYEQDEKMSQREVDKIRIKPLRRDSDASVLVAGTLNKDLALIPQEEQEYGTDYTKVDATGRPLDHLNNRPTISKEQVEELERLTEIRVNQVAVDYTRLDKEGRPLAHTDPDSMYESYYDQVLLEKGIVLAYKEAAEKLKRLEIMATEKAALALAQGYKEEKYITGCEIIMPGAYYSQLDESGRPVAHTSSSGFGEEHDRIQKAIMDDQATRTDGLKESPYTTFLKRDKDQGIRFMEGTIIGTSKLIGTALAYNADGVYRALTLPKRTLESAITGEELTEVTMAKERLGLLKQVANDVKGNSLEENADYILESYIKQLENQNKWIMSQEDPIRAGGEAVAPYLWELAGLITGATVAKSAHLEQGEA